MDNIAELQRLIHNMIRIGTVSEVDTGKARVRITIGGLHTNWLPWLTARAGATRTWSPPTVGEQVLVIAMGGDFDTAIVLTGVYSDAHPAPITSPDKDARDYPDGTTITYDHAAHALTVDVPADAGQLTINVTGAGAAVTVNAPKIDLGEAADLEPSVLGDKLATWIKSELKQWLDTHQHIGNLGSPTSAASIAPAGPFQVGTAAQGGDVYSDKNRNQ